MTTKLQIQQTAARVQRCLEDPLISVPFPEEITTMSPEEITTMSTNAYIACVEREQALARFKCEQELVRLDEVLACLDEEDDINLESFDTCAVLAPLHFLYEKRIINNDALIDAVKKGQTSVVKMLLGCVDPSANYNYAIRKASENGHLDIVNMLLAEQRVDPSAYDNYAICAASHHGHLLVVRVLLADSRVDPISNGELRNSLFKF